MNTKKNKVVILQPSYLPWLGYFDQIQESDTFVFLDDVLYTKNDWRNRNRIKTPKGIEWITVPVSLHHRVSEHLLIKDAVIANPRMLKEHIKKLQANYSRAKYFDEVSLLLFPILNKTFTHIAELDTELIRTIFAYLSKKQVKFLRSSQIHVSYTDPTDRLIQMCKQLKATLYLTGSAAKSYLDDERFADAKIQLEYQDFHHPNYQQLWGEFEPYLSIVDALYNCGKDTLKTIRQGHA